MAKVGARFAIKEVDRGWNALRRAARSIDESRSFVKVGVFDSVNPRNEGKMTNSKLAAIHEFGAPKAGIPERSFIRGTVDEKRSEIVAFLRPLIVAIYEQKIEVPRVLDLLGLKVSGLIKRRVMSGSGIDPPNAPATILRKLRKGKWNGRTAKKAAILGEKIRAGDEDAHAASGKMVKPLIDTGRLINSVTWIVNTKGGG